MDLGELTEKAQYRKCHLCGAEFRTNEQASALEQYSDHTTLHNPTGAEWAEAYRRIQAAREKPKSSGSDRPI
jgi:hypothetical protein